MRNKIKSVLNIIVILFIVFALNSCFKSWDNNSGETDISVKENKLTIYWSICEWEQLNENCKDRKQKDNIDNILQINETVCNLSWNINESEYFDIFEDYNQSTDNISDFKFKDEDNIKTISFNIEKWKNVEDLKKWRDVNIMFDLTYFALENEIENDVLSNRYKILKNIISKWIWDFKIEYWDKINIFYLWTSDYWLKSEWHKNYAIVDRNNFVLKKQWSNLSWKYNISYICDKNKRKKRLTMYYNSQPKKSLNWKNKESDDNYYVSDLKSLEEEVIKVIKAKYNSWEFNKWTYLLESLDKNKDFINGADSLNILISDMFFQLHPDMRINKNIEWSEFDFTQDNIMKLWKYKDYSALYYNDIPEYMINKCTNNEELYLIWIELSDNLDLKNKMKTYYKDKLFKWCRVYFN